LLLLIILYATMDHSDTTEPCRRRCTNGGLQIRAPNTDDDVYCVCFRDYYGPCCEYKVSEKLQKGICLTWYHSCKYGTCEELENNETTCHCVAGYKGDRCESMDFSDNVCNSNPCYRGGECRSTSKNTEEQCLCKDGTFSQDCRNSNVSACINHKCQHDALCIPMTETSMPVIHLI
ncbi:unnamed protein product, partial [Didymodactylos carnosus]